MACLVGLILIVRICNEHYIWCLGAIQDTRCSVSGVLRDVWSRLKKSAPDQVKKAFSLAEKMGCMPHEYKLVFGDANVSLGFR
jgi:hypothetical protein